MINRSSAAMVNMTEKINDRMQSQIEVIQATGSTSSTNVYIWAKNIGTSRVDSIEQSDLFLGLSAQSRQTCTSDHLHQARTSPVSSANRICRVLGR